MTIKEENKTAFWEIYATHEVSSDKMIDLRAKNINKFADNYDKLTDEIAGEIAATYFEIESGTLKNEKTTFKKMKKIIGETQAARFLQIMNQVQLLIDVQIASEIPLIE